MPFHALPPLMLVAALIAPAQFARTAESEVDLRRFVRDALARRLGPVEVSDLAI